MKPREIFLAVHLVMAVLFSAACGSTVEVTTSSGAGGSGGSSGAGGSGGSGDCQGNAPLCVYGCGSDAFEPSVCQKGAWVCPTGTVDPNDCPAGTCTGAPLSCEVCNDGWTCVPNAACIGSCGGLVCATCNGTADGTITIGGCACSCKGSEYVCEAAPSCCNQDFDCSDKPLVPCVNNVCKFPVMGGCWADVECGPAMKCQGAVVCPCGFDCNVEDSPGTCVPN